MTDLKHQIEASLAGFKGKDLKQAAIAFLNTLGYRSEKTLDIENSTEAFLAQFDRRERSLRKDKALFDRWKSVDFLFQLTDDEIRSAGGQNELAFDSSAKVDYREIHSYLILALDLKPGHYTRTGLATITREINRLFDMPTLILFRYDDLLTFSVIDRRLHKRDQARDVLEKITLIKDIRCANPHRAHIEIFHDLSLQALHDKHGFTNFVELHAAWQKTLDSSELNKRFFQEIANWYFWAIDQVAFPKSKDIRDPDTYKAQSVIRLITRLIFCWFVKEKGLIPDDLFNPLKLRALLKSGPDLATNKQTTYYKAILQNLFFATLNQEMNTPEKPDSRKFRGHTKQKGGRDQHHMIHNVYRYEDFFQDPGHALQMFAGIPFLNGGLFECLDKQLERKGRTEEIRLDGFSDRDDNPLRVPDFLFFGPEKEGEEVGLNWEKIYGRRPQITKVRGLIHTFYRYKFTITENTPIEEEIALDPELSGKVFENLLAAYNPDTATTARKQTGSFFTPREIVNYMADESLISYLKGKLEKGGEKGGTDILVCDLSNPQAGMPVSPSITRRNLPHWTREGSIYWIAFRLADALPQEKLRGWKIERDTWLAQHPEPWLESVWKEYDERFGSRIEEWLDAGLGSRALARPDVRNAVKECLLRFNGDRLRLHAAVIMPTHVHLLLEPLEKNELSDLLKGIKGASARQANKRLGQTGAFWLDESYDHIVRSQEQYRHFLGYLAENPVKAGLHPDEYWLYQGDTDIPVCDFSKAQAEMPVPPFEERLRHLFAYNEEPHQFSPAEVKILIESIDTLKALDPACGSGAFPMGILHKLVFILGKVDPRNEQWQQRQIAHVEDAIRAAEKIEDAAIRERTLRDLGHQIANINEAFEHNELDYGRKLYLIENCIYGVDIQPIAVQIAKMRFFISLIVDQKTDPKSENLGIRPLPNLETKFVAANTLVGIECKERQADFLTEDTAAHQRLKLLRQELTDVRHRHFIARTPATKTRCRERDRELRQEMSTLLEAAGVTAAHSRQLAGWDPYDQNASAEFFDPEWMFGIRDGFDVVIGNPPYGFRDVLSPEQKQYFRKVEGIAFPSGDIAELFVIKSLGKLAKTHGALTLIIPKKSLYGESWENVRKLWRKNSLRFLLDASQAFENVLLEQVAFGLRKSEPEKPMVTVGCLNFELQCVHVFGEFELNEIFSDDMRNAQIYRGLYSKSLLTKLKSQAIENTSGIIRVEIGISNITPYLTFEAKGNHPCVKGIDIVRYGLKPDVRYLKRGVAKRHIDDYTHDKLIAQEIVAHIQNPRPHILITMFHDVEGRLFNDTCVEIKVLDQRLNPKFVMAYYHSVFVNWFAYNFVYNRAIRTMHFIDYYVTQIPIPKSVLGDPSLQKSVVSLVDRMLAEKLRDPGVDTTAWEREIDRHVYALYGLTPEEIKIVEGTTT